jgi:hypothetical protein
MSVVGPLVRPKRKSCLSVHYCQESYNRRSGWYLGDTVSGKGLTCRISGLSEGFLFARSFVCEGFCLRRVEFTKGSGSGFGVLVRERTGPRIRGEL